MIAHILPLAVDRLECFFLVHRADSTVEASLLNSRNVVVSTMSQLFASPGGHVAAHRTPSPPDYRAVRLPCGKE